MDALVDTAVRRKTLTGLRPQVYEHPLDKRALDALEGISGLESLVRIFNEHSVERMMRIQFTGSNLHVNADNLPEVHEMARAACEILDLPRLPEIYIQADGSLNAFTAGVDKPLIVLNSGCIDLLSSDELFFVMAHELGHIKSGHVLYYQIAQFLPIIGEIIGAATFGTGKLISVGIEVALLNWQRMAEFTADRAGLLACQDADTAIRAMIKIAGLPQKFYHSINTEDFIAQAREFAGFDVSKLDRIAKAISAMGQSHPWTVMRAHEFLKWVDSGDYERILAAPARPLLHSAKSFCPNCGYELKTAVVFCPECGTKTPSPAAALK
jgi:Zn-dependent protease with chaperone function